MPAWLISVLDHVDSDKGWAYVPILRELVPKYGGSEGFGGDVVSIVEGPGQAKWISGIKFPDAQHAIDLVQHPEFVGSLDDRLARYKRTLYIVGTPDAERAAERGWPQDNRERGQEDIKKNQSQRGAL